MPSFKDLVDSAQAAAGRAAFFCRVHGPEMKKLIATGIRIERFVEGIGDPVAFLKRHAPALIEDFVAGRIRLEQGRDGRVRIVHECGPVEPPPVRRR